MSTSVLSQVKEIFLRFPNAVDRNAILRKKEFILEETDILKNIVYLNVTDALTAILADEATTEVNIRDHFRLDAHVFAILRFKQGIEGTELPYTGKAVPATHADIHEAGARSRRIKIKRIKDGKIHLDNHVTVKAGSEIRLMKIERAHDQVEAICRVCETQQWLPVFHGIHGICRDCNTTKVNPAKNKMGSHLAWLLEEGMFFEEIGPKPRTINANDVDVLNYERGIFTLRLKDNSEVRCYQSAEDGSIYKEIVRNERIPLREFKVEEVDEANSRFRSGAKWYKRQLAKWAQGLEKKMATLRTNKNNWHSREFSGLFINEETFGDQTLAHMRRMFNIARAKQLVDRLYITKKNYEEATDEISKIFDQPDCSRQLYTIVKEKLDRIRQAGNFNVNLHTDWAKKIVGMMTAIDIGMRNTDVSHA